jgi:cation transport regulator ChaC
MFMSKVWIFFYGSFINREVLKEAGLVPDKVEVACLWGFDIRIEPLASILRADGHCVYGIICQATHSELSRLYGQEWLGTYLPEAVMVQTRDGRVLPALVYVAASHTPAPPAEDYIDRIIGPARTLGFPAWYLDRLEHLRPNPPATPSQT